MARSRLLALLVLITGSFAVVPGIASAAVPRVDICIETNILPAIGTCPQPPGQTPASPAEPEKKPKPKKKAKKKKTACRDRNLRPTSTNSVRVRKATLCLLNRERRTRGLKALKAHSGLTGTARRYGSTMVDKAFFAHVSPSGSTLHSRVKRTSYLKSKRIRRWTLGENLAWGMGKRATPSQIVRSWMRSPGHKRNVLDRKFRDIGIGVATGTPKASTRSRVGATYVTVFGLRVHR